ncbi:MAG: serine hydroxymethyltransferase [Planctomycetes bacterium]|nr:serine hydroxymethyltransferase [Planctomycetota bacterium]
MSVLTKTDPEIAQLIEAEKRRQSMTLELIASENHVSAAVLQTAGTLLTDKYAEGYPGRRWYCGCENADAIEQLAIDRAKKLFGAEHANVQPHCGTSANLAVYLAALKPGAKIMGMRLDQGGHLSHGLNINLSGITYRVTHYGVRRDTEMLDLDEVRWLAVNEKPDLLVVGASAYPRTIDFKGFAEIASEVGCLILADIAHIAGLVAAGVHPSPVPHCQFVTTTTHKTLCGPRGGVILCKKDWAKKIDSAIFPGLQGGPLMHVIAAKAVCFLEALNPEFEQYAATIIANAKALAEQLIAKGWRLVSGGTDNHLMLVDLRSRLKDLTGHNAALWLARAGLICNKNTIPFDTRPPIESSGIRLGTPALTSRGMGSNEMARIAAWIDQILLSGGDSGAADRVRGQVEELCRQFPIPGLED